MSKAADKALRALLRQTDDPRQRMEPVELALAAWQAAQGAFAAGDLATALAWSERAYRLGPEDTQIAFLLGLILLRRNDRRASEVFRALAARSDTLPALGGLIAAEHRFGARDRAARAAQSLLQRFALPRDESLRQSLGAIAAAHGLAGWCGVDAGGRLIVSGAGALEIRLDGRLLRLAEDPEGLALPPVWRRSATLAVSRDGMALLGSPIDLAARRRVEGFVEATEEGGLTGWAWLPQDPETIPTLLLTDPEERFAPIPFLPEGPAQFPNLDGLTRPRAFGLSAEAIPARAGLVHVTADGRDLTGSPLAPALWRRAVTAAARQAAQRAPLAQPLSRRAAPPDLVILPALAPLPPREAAPPRRRPGVAVVMPVYRGRAETLRALSRILATVPPGTPVIVVDDASPEPDLSAALDALAAARRIRLLRHRRNRGFPTSANDGMRAAGRRDVVLVNSDALVPPGWLERLAEAAYAAPDIGSAAPLSNDATILSYPATETPQPAPDRALLDRIDRFARRANGAAVVDIPTSVGFCMFIRRDCLDEAGAFREDLFAQGYGEENDFCLRARHLGWRHVAAPGVFVAHIGGVSFGAARAHLLRRNLAILDRLHPGYHELVAAHAAADPLHAPRQRIDRLRWAAQRRGESVVLITHDEGGGVERQVRARAAALGAEGLTTILLRPGEGFCHAERLTDDVEEGAGWSHTFPDLRFRLPEELPALAALLRGDRVRHVELHHTLGHDHAILGLADLLGVPLDLHIHDYAPVCPRITLVNETRRYCGEPEEAQCEICVADLGSRLDEEIAVGALRRRSAGDVAAARRVVVPTADAASRLRRYLPNLVAEERPWEDDSALPALPWRRPRPPQRRRRVAVVGAVGTEKGYDVLLACARDAAQRDLPLEFIVIGYTHDDPRLIATGRAFVTYRFAPEQALAEIAAQEADIGFIPSVWPETWCFALSDAWRAGLRVAVFDIGAQAERVRATGRGWILPLALSSSAINNSLLALADQPA